jgi:hypothetical protein
MIPYTHWAYFETEEKAQACVKALGEYVTRIDPPIESDSQWLLRAGRDVEIGGLAQRHDEVEAIVVAHGGLYDFGESGYLVTEAGFQPMPDPVFDRSGDPRDD